MRVHLAQNLLSLYNMETLSKYNSSIWIYTPAPSPLSMKLKSKDLLYLTKPLICGLNLEHNQVLGPARGMVSVRGCDKG